MNSISKISDISDRIDHLESAAEWIARITVNQDQSVSQSATLIQVLADDIRQLICGLVRELENGIERQKLN